MSLHALPGPQDIHRSQLPNGVTILARPNLNSPSVVIHGYLEAGSLFDPSEKLGLAQFTSLALMRGSQRHSFQQIYDLLESTGASLGVSGATHTTGFSGRSLAEDLPLLLDLLKQVLRFPTFPAEHVERLRAQILTGLAIRAQDTGDMASLTFDEIVYQGHPYSRPDDGFPETVQAIQRDDLLAFHHKHYGPQGMLISIVGAVPPETAIEQVAALFGDWSNPSQSPQVDLPALEPLPHTVSRRLYIPQKAQADLVIGAAGPPRRSPDFLPALLGNNILGQFGMMGRIGERLREQAGLSYYASSSLGGGPGPGPWDVSAGVNPADLDQAIDLILDEIRRFTSQPVSEQELSDCQSNFTGSLPLSMESNAGVAYALLNMERYQLGMDYYLTYADRINAITRQQILDAAQRYLDVDRLAIVAAGELEESHE
jgi:zinc protease